MHTCIGNNLPMAEEQAARENLKTLKTRARRSIATRGIDHLTRKIIFTNRPLRVAQRAANVLKIRNNVAA